MRTALILLTASCLLVPVASAQNDVSDVHQMTTAPSDARFQIIQSELAAKWTFKLDRFTGAVFQLVKTKQDESAWEEMVVENRSNIAQPTKPRFQIFTSGITAKWTFLIDTATGHTWQLVSSSEKQPDGTEQQSNSWHRFSE